VRLSASASSRLRPGAGDKIWLHLRAGEHPTTAGDIESFIDFTDTIFSRKSFPKFESFTHGYAFEGWRKLTGETVDPLQYPRRQVGETLKSGTCCDTPISRHISPTFAPLPAAERIRSAPRRGPLPPATLNLAVVSFPGFGSKVAGITKIQTAIQDTFVTPGGVGDHMMH
jgi:hypothetical protein